MVSWSFPMPRVLSIISGLVFDVMLFAVGLAKHGLEFEMMGVSWGSDRIGLFFACGLSMVGAGGVGFSIVVLGSATVGIGEVLIFAS